jgi:phospholipase/carboxylesterase
MTYIHRIRPGKPGQPILFAFHGTGGDENQFFDFAAGILPDATIVSPRGDVSEHGAARFFKRTGEGVYDMEDLARATEKMADYVSTLKEEHQAGQALGFGYSNGANILANLMIEKGDLFDVAALLHPLIPFKPKDQLRLARKRVLITAGMQDPICPAPLTQSLGDYFKAQQAEVELVWHGGGHDLRQNEVAVLQRFLTAAE